MYDNMKDVEIDNQIDKDPTEEKYSVKDLPPIARPFWADSEGESGD